VGDRANFGFRDGENTLFVYGHWAGYQMLAQLANAVHEAEPRWSDNGYAIRIAVSHLVGDQWTEKTGWGLYINQIADNEHHVPIVDFQNRTFALYEHNWTWDNTKIKYLADNPKFTMPLDEFVAKYQKVLAP
jgi:hypothetical protein